MTSEKLYYYLSSVVSEEWSGAKDYLLSEVGRTHSNTISIEA